MMTRTPAFDPISAFHLAQSKPGAGGTAEVTPVYLCGAQALGIAWGRRWSTRTNGAASGSQ